MLVADKTHTYHLSTEFTWLLFLSFFKSVGTVTLLEGLKRKGGVKKVIEPKQGEVFPVGKKLPPLGL